jgi:hypothetical protein
MFLCPLALSHKCCSLTCECLRARVWVRPRAQVNVKLKDTLKQAGGATNIIVKLVLLILLCAIGAYVYKIFA